jgi:hypothetical protein
VGPANQSCSAIGGFGTTGSGGTLVDYGHIHVTGTAFGTLDEASRGVIQDNLTFHIPGAPDGTAGSFTYELFVSGSLGPVGDLGAASWNLSTNVGGGPVDLQIFYRLGSPGVSNPGFTGSPYGTYFATGHFQSGLPAPLQITFDGASQARLLAPGVPGSASDDSQLFWGGISGVVAGGVPITTFTVTSDSGTNWAQSFIPASTAPEPAASATLGAGLILIVLAGRRKLRNASTTAGTGPLRLTP